jgi:hypothetical protein
MMLHSYHETGLTGRHPRVEREKDTGAEFEIEREDPRSPGPPR